MTVDGPTKEQADVLGILLHAGLPASEAIPYVAPLVDSATWPELIRKWPRSKAVLDVRVRLQGGAWTDLPDADKIRLAVEFARRCQAWLVVSQNPLDLKSEQLSLWKECVKELQTVIAGTAGASDPSVAFFEKALKEMQAGGGKYGGVKATPKAETH